MSLTFGYFQYHPDMIFSLLFVFIEAIMLILLNIMLLRSGRAEEGMQKQKILVSLSIINIVFILLPFAVPSIVATGEPLTEIEITILRFYILLSGLLARIPFFITYGIMMSWYGKVNRTLLSRNYMVSAWIFLVCNGFFVINFTFAFVAALTSSQLTFIDIQGALRVVFLLVYLVGWIFLGLHGKIAGNNNFLYAGILGCIMVFFMWLSYTTLIITLII